MFIIFPKCWLIEIIAAAIVLPKDESTLLPVRIEVAPQLYAPNLSVSAYAMFNVYHLIVTD